jgi:diguanylate cyclase (GGDEF)-like protein/PAS domain S-box-containing protein
MPFSQESTEANQLYRLILDHALDAFIAIDERGDIVQWNLQAENIFGWTKDEVLGRKLADTIVPPRYRAAHAAGMARYLKTGEQHIMGRRVEIEACRSDGREIPIELTINPIHGAERMLFSASMRDLSHTRALEDKVRQQADITQSVLDSMADAVVVAERSGSMLMINPAGRRLFDLPPADPQTVESFRSFTLFEPDGRTPMADGDRPLTRALLGEHVRSRPAFVRHVNPPQGMWLVVNAHPLINPDGLLLGAVAVFHDITQLRHREEALTQQARMLQEQASLLDLSHDAILVRDAGDIVTYVNRSACALYGFSKEEAIGRHVGELFSTEFPQPLETIRDIMRTRHYWSGRLRQRTRDGRDLVVYSQWALDAQAGAAARYLETNMDITQQVHTERALRETQESYRLVVETSTEYAIITTDPDGIVETWNIGAERITGVVAEQAIGQPVSAIFTPEDRNMGQHRHELEKARIEGRSEDMRWHLRKDGSRFWGTGVTMPLWNDNGDLRGFVKILRDQTNQRLNEEQNQFFALHDMLTGLPNRVHLSNQLHKLIAASQRNRIPLSVLLLDLDRFKAVNDTFGHHVGDLLLKEVAQRILSAIRETDFVARLGGDEFVVIQADVSQPQAAQTLARKLVARLGDVYVLDGHEVHTGTSIGISTSPKDGANAVELLKKADLALYRAKSAGRGTYDFYASTLAADSDWQTRRTQALRDALANNELQLYYQPQVDLDSWKISTVEALLRWNVADVELALPGDFLDFAEETGLIVDIGEWALREACRQVKIWQEKGMPHLRISVNCSARQFSDPDFVDRVLPILEQSGLTAPSLELEVRESMLSTQPGIKEQLAALRAAGVRITIDNYGTGSSTLADLKDFEVDSLKIDRAFVEHLPHRRKDSAIASAIIGLAHDLGISVSAGGVETAEQLAYLKARDCTSAQGFIFSPPIPADKLEEIMLSDHWSRINRIPFLDNGKVFDDLH